MQPTRHVSRNKALALAVAAPFLLAACGSSSGSSSSSSSTATTAAASTSTSKTHAVATIDTSKTAQVLAGASAAGSKSDEATFTITALNHAGSPVAGAPVSFSIGQMVPVSGHPPTSFTQSTSSAASSLIASASKTTNAQGQATITVFGQPANTMEMIGVRAGTLSTFSKKTGKAFGAMSVWWTSGSMPKVGNYVTVSPFATAVKVGSAPALTIAAGSSSGPISGATVSVTIRHAVAKGKSAASGMAATTTTAAGGGMGSAAAATTLTTGSSGTATFPVPLPTSGRAKVGVRVVVTMSGGRVAGGMLAQVMQR